MFPDSINYQGKMFVEGSKNGTCNQTGLTTVEYVHFDDNGQPSDWVWVRADGHIERD